MNLKIKGNVEIESAVVVTEEERGVVMACVGAGINALVPLPTAAKPEGERDRVRPLESVTSAPT